MKVIDFKAAQKSRDEEYIARVVEALSSYTCEHCDSELFRLRVDGAHCNGCDVSVDYMDVIKKVGALNE